MVMDPLPSMNKVFLLVLQYENQFLVSDKETESLQEVAAFVQKNNNLGTYGVGSSLGNNGFGGNNSYNQFNDMGFR